MFPSSCLANLPPRMQAQIEDAVTEAGYAGIAAVMAIETVFPPIPSEAVLPLAGYLVEQGEFRFLTVVITATAGSVLGSVLLYEAARHGGRPFVNRFLRVGHLDPERLAQAEQWFAKRGPWVVLFGRFVPGVRSIVALPAGLLRMPRWEYLLFTLIGSAIWNTALVGAGYLLGTQWERVEELIGPVGKPLLVALVVVGAGVLLWRALRS